ncbi:MFS transporter [Pseudoduganella umbonata]|nr:MFS transporter [Pseudoduganella umbonata]MBB3221188.1 AAHS family 4-hydroxybenzoate transporter-like MFS transporter [Pseudoduganella umbonata]
MDTQAVKGGGYRTLVDDSPLSGLQWAVFVLCFLIMFLDGLDTVLIGFLAPYIGAEWQLPKGALTPAFTAGVVGLMIAGCAAGILADRIGRRPLLLAAVAVFGLANLATAWCGSLEALVALRFVTGLGLGAAMPCAVTLVSEYAPARRRALVITSMYCGYTLGGAAVGWLTPIVTQQHGWRAMFVVGAVLPLALLPWLFWRLPESIGFLAERRRDRGAVAALLSRIAGRQVEPPALPDRPAVEANPLAIFLSPAYRLRTGLLWLANGAGLLMTFTLINWLPSFLTFKGVPAATASLSGASLQAGGAAGALLIGWLMDRFGSRKVVVGTYLGAAIAALLWIAVLDRGSAVLLLMGFAAGVLVMGGQTGFQVLATSVYPVAARATGLSWMQSVGRLGGILGIQLAGMGVASDVDPVTLLQALALPALVAAIAAGSLHVGFRPAPPEAAAVKGG